METGPLGAPTFTSVVDTAPPVGYGCYSIVPEAHALSALRPVIRREMLDGRYELQEHAFGKDPPEQRHDELLLLPPSRLHVQSRPVVHRHHPVPTGPARPTLQTCRRTHGVTRRAQHPVDGVGFQEGSRRAACGR